MHVPPPPPLPPPGLWQPSGLGASRLKAHTCRLHAWFRRKLDSLSLFAEVPVNPSAHYLVGVQVRGIPGSDFLSPIGTPGVSIAAAINPCIGGCTSRRPFEAVTPALVGSHYRRQGRLGYPSLLGQAHLCSCILMTLRRSCVHVAAGDYSFAFEGLNVGVEVPTPPNLAISIGVSLAQLAYSKSGSIDPAAYPKLKIPQFWTPVGCV